MQHLDGRRTSHALNDTSGTLQHKYWLGAYGFVPFVIIKNKAPTSKGIIMYVHHIQESCTSKHHSNNVATSLIFTLLTAWHSPPPKLTLHCRKQLNTKHPSPGKTGRFSSNFVQNQSPMSHCTDILFTQQTYKCTPKYLKKKKTLFQNVYMFINVLLFSWLRGWGDSHPNFM